MYVRYSKANNAETLILFTMKRRIMGHQHTSAFVNMVAPASFAAAAIANDTEPIPPSTYLHVKTAVKNLFYLLREDNMIKSPSQILKGNFGFETKTSP